MGQLLPLLLLNFFLFYRKLRRFHNLGILENPFFILMTLLKVYKMHSGLWKVTARCGYVRKTQATKSSPRRHLPSSEVRHTSSAVLPGRDTPGPVTLQHPQRWPKSHIRLWGLIKLPIDGDHFLHVFFLPVHYLSAFFSEVQTFREGTRCPL